MKALFNATRRLATILLGIALTLVVLGGVARAGTAYVYCRMAGTIGEAPCCKHQASHDAEPTVSSSDMDCCEGHVLPPLPTATNAGDLPSIAAPRAVPVVAPLLLALLEPATLVPSPAVTRARAGPWRPRSASEARSLLMVFLR